MSIQKVKIKNFQLVTDLEQDFGGKSLIICGENGIGKSSLLRAIQIALGSKKIPPFPITHGQDHGYVEVITDIDGKEHKFTATFLPGKTPKIEVTSPDGLRDDRKGVIRSLVGGDDFDINHFVEDSKTSEGKKRQVELFKSYFDKELIADLDRHQLRIKNHEQERTEIGRTVKSNQGFIDEAGINPHDFVKYGTKIDVSDLNKRLSDANEINKNHTIYSERSDERKIRLNNIDLEIAKLQKEGEDLEFKEKTYVKWIAENSQIDIAPLQEEIDNATTHNEMATKVAVFKDKEEMVTKSKEEYGEITVLIETQRQALSDAIKDMGSPIDGLEFDLDQLYYNGHPVDINTLSTSEIMYLGVELKMAANPNVKVLFIERGESIGAKRLKDLQLMAQEHGYQIMMEEVERGTETMEFRFLTDVGNTDQVQEEKSGSTSEGEDRAIQVEENSSEVVEE